MSLQSQRVIGGTTSMLARVFIGQAAAPSQGAVGITSGAGLTLSHIRAGAATSTFTAVTSGVTGTYAGGTLIQIDGVNLAGLYELGIPNAAVASGARAVDLYLGGTAGIIPVVLHLDISPGDAYVALTQTTFAEPSAVIASTDTLANKLGWLAALARNKVATSATTQSLYQDGATTTISTAAVADDGTTAQRGQWA